MKRVLRTILDFVNSFEGFLVLIILIGSLIMYFRGSKDIAFIATVLGFLVAIIFIIKDKFQKIGLIENKLHELNNFLAKIRDNEIINYKLPETKSIEKWEKDSISNFRKELSKNISVNNDKLISQSLDSWVKLLVLKNESQADFLKYLFYREVYDSETDLQRIIKKNLGNEGFLCYVYSYFIDTNKDLNSVFNKSTKLTEEQKQKSIFFLKGIIEEFETVLNRIDSLKGSEDKNKFLEKLNTEMREYLHSKGISLDKYAEAFLSKNKHAFLLFQQKLGGELKNKLTDKNIKNLPLYFTGPYLIISDKIKSAYDLKKSLQLEPKSSESHNLLITRILPSDVHISSGIDKKSKKSSKKQIKRIREILTKVGELSVSTKKYALILDKPLKEFVESLNFDFLIINKIKDQLKITLRESTESIKAELKNEGYTVTNITDLYNVPVETIKKVISKIGITKDTDKMAISLKKGAESWRYILYGYGKDESDSKK